MAAAAAEAAVSGRMIPAAILGRAVPLAARRAVPWRRAPEPAKATWTTIFRSEFFSLAPLAGRGSGVRGTLHALGTSGESPSPGRHLRCHPTSPRKRGEVT